MIIKPHILIVEDDYILYDAMQNMLIDEGYSVSDYTPSLKDALKEIQKKRPDLALLDIQLQGEGSGIDFGHILKKEYQIPFIYITEFDDRHTFNKALQTKHEIFMVKTKPVLNEQILLRNIETVLNRIDEKKSNKINPIGITGLVEYLDEIKKNRHKEISKVKVPFSDIVFFSKDRFINQNNEPEDVKINYIWFERNDGEIFFLKSSLDQILEIIPYNFVRINGKYIINLTHKNFLGRINGNRVQIKDKILNISNTYKDEFNQRLKYFFPEKI